MSVPGLRAVHQATHPFRLSHPLAAARIREKTGRDTHLFHPGMRPTGQRIDMDVHEPLDRCTMRVPPGAGKR